eukprot:1143935-Pelagomonas_calceolata.AAC.2
MLELSVQLTSQILKRQSRIMCFIIGNDWLRLWQVHNVPIRKEKENYAGSENIRKEKKSLRKPGPAACIQERSPN